MKSAACLSNMNLCTTGQHNANGIDTAKKISQPLCTFYNLLCSSPINSYIDFAIKYNCIPITAQEKSTLIILEQGML